MVNFVKGQFHDFSAVKEFGLNWDDRNIKSIKVRVGETVSYDGEVAMYAKPSGEIVTGRCPGLKSAINNLRWLVLKKNRTLEPLPGSLFPSEEMIPKAKEEYDPKKGGSFDAYAAQEADVFVATTKKSNVIREDDLIVKKTAPMVKLTRDKKPEGKLEVAGDQVDVKEVRSDRTIVNSSTSIKKEVKRYPVVQQADEMGADSTQPIHMTKKSSTTEPKKKNTYIVDNTTPRTISEGMTKDEVQRITKPIVQADESQDAQVVKKLDMSKKDSHEVEGITLRKVPSPEGVTFSKGSPSNAEMNVKAKMSSGGEPVVAIADEGKVVKIISPDAAKAAAARAEQRKKLASQTQAQLEQEKAKEPVKVEETVKVEAQINPDKSNYLSMLPEDWGKLHWVKKEKFIMAQTDINFIKFIMSVETTKAVQNACNERLSELEQGKNS